MGDSWYDIWKTDKPPYFEVKVLCSVCNQEIKKCSCEYEYCEDCEELEQDCVCHRYQLAAMLRRGKKVI